MTKKIFATLLLTWCAFIFMLMIGMGHITKKQMPEMWHGKIYIDSNGNQVNTMDEKREKRDMLISNLNTSIFISWLIGSCGVLIICRAYYKNK